MKLWILILFCVTILDIKAKSRFPRRILRSTKWWQLYREYQLSPAYLDAETNNVTSAPRKPEDLTFLRPWFTKSQWRQFRGFTPTGNRDRNVISSELIRAALDGLITALTECQVRFKYDRWNCTMVSEGHLFGRLLLRGIPQTAFLYSVVSAGVTRAVAQACLTSVTNCPCNDKGRPALPDITMTNDTESPTIRWEWEGCDHNAKFARRFSRKLLDSPENREEVRSLMNLHNNEAGRKHVITKMVTHCACHGTSGTCGVKTCFRRIPPMSTVGTVLKEQYLRAIRVVKDESSTGAHGKKDKSQKNKETKDSRKRRRQRRHLKHGNRENLRVMITRRRRARASVSSTRPSSDDLVYIETPPKDLFCNSELPTISSSHVLWKDVPRGGTIGRECHSASKGTDSCTQLCCGRGHDTFYFYDTEKCRCTFVWCCHIVCQTCLRLRRKEVCR